jgi:hypothetical protein
VFLKGVNVMSNMSNETNEARTDEAQQSTTQGTGSSEVWQDVGKQFQILGQSLATAFRAAWNDEQNRQRVGEMQKGVESMLNDVGKAINETAKSPQVQQAKSEAQRAAESLRVASEQTYQEVRPHLLSALQQLNTELQKLVQRMEPSKPAGSTTTTREDNSMATDAVMETVDATPPPASPSEPAGTADSQFKA